MTDGKAGRDASTRPPQSTARRHGHGRRRLHRRQALSPLWFFAALWAATALVTVLVFILEVGT